MKTKYTAGERIAALSVITGKTEQYDIVSVKATILTCKSVSHPLENVDYKIKTNQVIYKVKSHNQVA